MKIERLLEKLISLKLTKQIEKLEPKKESSLKEKVLEMYVSPNDDVEKGTFKEEVFKNLKIKQTEGKKKEPTLEEKAREGDRETSKQRALLEANKNG